MKEAEQTGGNQVGRPSLGVENLTVSVFVEQNTWLKKLARNRRTHVSNVVREILQDAMEAAGEASLPPHDSGRDGEQADDEGIQDEKDQ